MKWGIGARSALRKHATRIVATALGASIAISLMPALPAEASDQSRVSTALVTVDDAIDSGGQVLVAEGDGWSLYIEAVDGSAAPMTVADCGIVTCSVYLSRAQTQSANNNINALGGGIAGLAAACGFIALLSGPAAPVIAVACGAQIAVMGVSS